MSDFFVQNLDEKKINLIAKETSFCKRIRKLSPINFLKSLCFKSFDSKNQSLNDHCTDILLTENIKITKQSFSEKFNENTVCFLKKVLNSFEINTKQSEEIKLLNLFSNVYIQDGTYFKLPLAYLKHYQGMGNKLLAGAKIMFTFDFKNGNFIENELIEGKKSDANSAQNCSWITPNSLILRDLGFFSIESLKEIVEKKAFYISKLQPRTNIYIKKGDDYVKLEIKNLVNNMKINHIKSINLKVYIGNKKEIETTALIQLMPEHIVNERIRSKKKKGEGRNWNMTEEYAYWAHLNIFVTNIKSNNYDIKDIIRIYKLRWQIEIVFKTWKSHHKIHEYKALSIERFQCYVYGTLIGLLLEFKIYHYFKIYCFDKYQKIVSILKFSKIMIQQKHELKMLFKHPKEVTIKLISLLFELRNKLYLEIKKGKENQYNVLNINKI